MKRCPKCYRANADEVDQCVLCHEPLKDVEASPFFDSLREAEQLARNNAARGKKWRSDVIGAAVIYAVAIVVTVMLMGFVFDPAVLLYFFVSALLLVFLVSRRITGQFWAALLQGGISMALIVAFIPVQPLVFFLMLAHVVLPVCLCHWLDGLRDMYR